MLFATPPLRMARLGFKLRPRRPMCMTLEERGNALRGGFGTAFQRLVCHSACPGVRQCPDRHTCAYACIFEPTWPEAASTLGTFDLPRPFIFRPPLGKDLEFNSVRPLLFELRLFGEAIRSYEFFIRAFRMLTESGFGHPRVPFDLVSVVSLDWLGSSNAILWGDGQVTGARPVPLDLQVCMDQPALGSCLTIDFITPTLVKENGVELRVPTLTALVSRLRDRLSHLCLAYENHHQGEQVHGAQRRYSATLFSRLWRDRFSQCLGAWVA